MRLHRLDFEIFFRGPFFHSSPFYGVYRAVVERPDGARLNAWFCVGPKWGGIFGGAEQVTVKLEGPA